MYKFKLTNLELNDGTLITPAEITVFVGPNNVGKSRILKDILAHVTQLNPSGVVVRSVEISRPASLADLRAAYDVEPFSRGDQHRGVSQLSPTMCEGQPTGFTPDWETWTDLLIRQTHTRQFWQQFGSALITYLSTEHRLQLVKESKSPSHERQRASLLQQLYYAGPDVEAAIRAVVKRAFERTEIALDFSSPQNFQLRVGDDFSSLPPDPRLARSFLEASLKLDEQGDGIRAFVGIVVALLTVKRDVILVDEPETFLHPPQALRIGEFLSEHSSESRQIVVATHSVDVLRGILSKNHRNVSIIRIDRTGDVNRFRTLDPGRLQDLVTDPLLSSARVLEGIFYKGSVVVEADSDARFYQSASRRIAENLDLHFVNADNKQTVPRILRIYRDLGVRCAGIVDIDVLNDAAEFEKQLEAFSSNKGEIDQARQLRADIAASVSEIPPNDHIAALREALSEIADLLPPDDPGAQQLAEGTARDLARQIDRMLRKVIETGKPWREVKQKGRAALSPDMKLSFDRLSETARPMGSS